MVDAEHVRQIGVWVVGAADPLCRVRRLGLIDAKHSATAHIQDLVVEQEAGVLWRTAGAWKRSRGKCRLKDQGWG